jgi:hypothetical protein
MKRKNIFKTVVIVAVALAFIMPGSAAFAHVKETTSRYSTTMQTQSTSSNWLEAAKLTASDGSPPAFFGFSVSIDGDTAIVGAWYQGGLKGAAYVYRGTGTTWTQEAILTASDGAPPDEFGYSVSIDGDYVIVGCYNDNDGRGSAYIFRYTGTTWTQEAKLTAADGVSGDGFGYTVSINGNSAIAGAWRDENLAGAAYVYTRTGTNWTQEAKLTASDGDISDYFGYSVSINGDSAIVGARNKEAVTGAAYIFTRTGTTWTEQQKLLASDGEPEDQYGLSVSINGDSASVGRSGDVRLGAAYVYTRTGTTWTQEAELVGSDSVFGSGYGWCVSINGDSLIVGSPGGDNNNGSAYIFTRTGTHWTQEAKVTASDATPGDFLGLSVSISGGSAIAGAFGDDGYKGSAYVFRKPVALEIGIIKGGFGVTSTIKNTGLATATNVSWSMKFDGSLVFPKEKIGTIDTIVAGEQKTAKAIIFGIGKTTILVTATCDEGATAELSKTAFVFGPFVIGVK